MGDYRTGCVWLGIPARERDPASLARLLEDFRPRLLMLEKFGPYGSMTLREERYSAREIPPPPGIDPNQFRGLLRSSEDGDVEFVADDQPIQRLRYTSGSAGEPKAVAYTEETLRTMLSMIAETVLEGRKWTVVHGLPVTWASGSLIAPALCRGGENVILETWDIERFVRAVARKGAWKVLSLLTPGLLSSLSRYSEANGADWAGRLGRVVLAGGPTPVSTMRRARDLFPRTEFFVTLGQTEASFPITWHLVTSKDVDGEDGPALVPLGVFTDHYPGSDLDRRSREILLRGDAVAPGIWDPDERQFVPLATPEEPHGTGDRARMTGRKPKRILHYLGRMTDPWRGDVDLPAADAIEAVLNECPGVNRSRVDLLETKGTGVDAAVTVQPMDRSFSDDRLRDSFEESKKPARLGSVVLRRISIGEVELTLSGKVKRSRPPARSGRSPNGGASSPPPGPEGPAAPTGGCCSSPVRSTSWREFDFSRIAGGPLYYYVGAGLSMAAGLVSWSEMACLIWAYRKGIEGAEDPPCPETGAAAIEKFLDEFVRETCAQDTVRSPAILSRDAGERREERRTMGRAALLNMLFRYRGPRVRLVPAGREAVPDPNPKNLRLRPGEEPSQEDLTIQSMIWRSRCHGVFTTNYDMLLEHAFSLYHHGAALRTYRYKADFLRFILSNPHFVLKLHGDINDIATMELRPIRAWSESGGLWDEEKRGNDLEEVYRAALERGHMIYLGCGFSDATIERLHRSWTPTDTSRRQCRIALLKEQHIPSISARVPWQGIEFLGLEEYSEIKEFMENVVSARSEARERWASCPEAVDLHRQLFLSWDPTKANRNFVTEPWTCRAESPPG